MKKYLAILGAGAISVGVFFVLPSDAYPYVHSGGAYALPGGCGAKAETAIKSVYPSADVADVQLWRCTRTFGDESDPNGARCWGRYHVTLSGQDWWANVITDGFTAWLPVPGGVDRDADTVTVERRTKPVKLDATQLAAHAPLLGCLKDDASAAVQWARIVDFVFYRKDGGAEIQVNYAVSASDPLDVAEAVEVGRGLWPLVVE